MDLEGILLSEICQRKQDEYCMISYTWNIKKVELIETESLMEVGEMERYWLKGANFHNKKNKF